MWSKVTGQQLIQRGWWTYCVSNTSWAFVKSLVSNTLWGLISYGSFDVEQFHVIWLGLMKRMQGGINVADAAACQECSSLWKHPHIYPWCQTPARRYYFNAEISQEECRRPIQHSQIHNRLASAHHREGKRVEEAGGVGSCCLVGLAEKRWSWWWREKYWFHTVQTQGSFQGR